MAAAAAGADNGLRRAGAARAAAGGRARAPTPRSARGSVGARRHSLCASDSNSLDSLAMRRQARLQDAVKFLVQEVRQGKLRPRLGAAHSPPAARQPRPSAATESEQDVAQLRRYRELEQRGEELAATVEARLAESDERVKVEMDWYGKVRHRAAAERRGVCGLSAGCVSGDQSAPRRTAQMV